MRGLRDNFFGSWWGGGQICERVIDRIRQLGEEGCFRSAGAVCLVSSCRVKMVVMALLMAVGSVIAAEPDGLMMARVYPVASKVTRKMTFFDEKGTRVKLNVDREPAVTGADVASAELVELGRKTARLYIVFTSEGAEKFRQLRASSIGGEIVVALGTGFAVLPVDVKFGTQKIRTLAVVAENFTLLDSVEAVGRLNWKKPKGK